MIMIICTIFGHVNFAVYKEIYGVESCVFDVIKVGNTNGK